LTSRRMTLGVLGVLVVLGACAPAGDSRADDSEARTIQPGPPGEAGRELTAEEAAALPRPEYTDADVRFMQGMIPHHQQALEMSALIEGRSQNRMIGLLGQRIAISQRDEIALMSRWLERRGEPLYEAPEGHEMHAEHMTEGHTDHGEDDHMADGHMAAHHPAMPGMLSPEEMEQLASLSGAEFDMAFLRYMIRHHEGALIMLDTLFASPGAGQETELFRFASDVDADQSMEIDRMALLLREIAAGAARDDPDPGAGPDGAPR